MGLPVLPGHQLSFCLRPKRFLSLELDLQQLAETLAGASMVATVNCLNSWLGKPDDLVRRLDQQADVLLNGCIPP